MIMLLILIFIIGICIGSFLNVVVLRSLSGESIVFPASKCPECQNPLKPWHNIPIFSYIGLRGKCAFCKTPISWQYPVIELVTGVVFTLLIMKFIILTDFSLLTSHFSLIKLLISLVCASLLIVIAGTDLREKVVFDAHTYILAGFGLLSAIIAAFYISAITPIISVFLGIIAGIVIMEAAARLGYLVAGTRAFGEGDTFIAAALGAVFGWRALLVILALSLIIQVIFTLPVFIKKLVIKKDYKTLATSGTFFVYTAGFALFAQKLGTGLLYMAGAAGLAFLGIYLCKLILSGLKDNPDDLTYLPFGPAMAISALIMLILV